jgi:hypothetical protein
MIDVQHRRTRHGICPKQCGTSRESASVSMLRYQGCFKQMLVVGKCETKLVVGAGAVCA